jgi:hypothetical protein
MALGTAGGLGRGLSCGTTGAGGGAGVESPPLSPQAVIKAIARAAMPARTVRLLKDIIALDPL